uniref:Uncharacterized protein AlNc14C19G2025 n=1 Tax=Albugo laibachii Nc14 TaxID=890382 RepID=F0W554_9STRA|nr:conserved hypothetical protein [Albugo laibachii Nc14]|eukprot:CCA16245.1 conserved hypothetical protein [Albugo laibachii Nc14]
MQRKLRKACSLPTCSRKVGQCMHCTCDGRCGQHVPGMCGVRREGNGKSCKHFGCSRDANCLHSTRATCCQCRNLIATRSLSAMERAKKRFKSSADFNLSDVVESNTKVGKIQDYESVDQSVLPLVAQEKERPNSSFSENDIDELLLLLGEENQFRPNGMEFGLENTSETPFSLWECKHWQARKDSCDLIVIANNVEFYIHQFPLLVQSKRLHQLAELALDISSNSSEEKVSIPIVKLPHDFPGDVELFEQLCIYWYSGTISHSLISKKRCCCNLNRLPTVIAAMEYLQVSTETQAHLRQLFVPLLREQTLEPLVCFINHVYEQMIVDRTQHIYGNKETLALCMQTLFARVQGLTSDRIPVLLTLPNEIFTQIMPNVLASHRDIANRTDRFYGECTASISV